MYCWADGIHVNIRLGEEKLCLLVLIGVRADGTKELITLADRYRESAESWADLLRDAKRRGMRAPVLAVGDGALGFWKALRDVFAETREARCWFHKIGNVLAAMPKSAHPSAKNALAEIWNAEDKTHAFAAVKQFGELFGAKFGKAVAKITDDLRRAARLLRLPRRTLGAPAHHQPDRVDLRHRPAPHQDHPRAGFESRRLAMAYKLIMAVQDRWRAVNAPHLVALVRAGATFVNGKLAERDEDQQSVTRPRVHRRRDIALVTGIQAVSQTLLT